MIGTINNWVSKVVGTVKAPLSAIVPEISTKKPVKAVKVTKTVKAKAGKKAKAKKSRRK